MVYRTPAHLLIRNEGVQNTPRGSIYHTGDSVFNKEVQHTSPMDENWALQWRGWLLWNSCVTNEYGYVPLVL